jgi:hypothetical protein
MMKLPNGDKAVVEDRKLWAYVLNPKHPSGREHAYLFKLLLGIDLSNWKTLKAELLRAAREENALIGRTSSFGQKYEVRFEMAGARGRYIILSVWIIEAGDSVPRLVTAYIE